VPHQRLLSKIRSFGIDGKLIDWISDFLTDRRQKVCTNGHESSWKKVKSGVPQGSVLGPALFSLYVSNAPNNLSNLTSLFADDTKLYSILNDTNSGDSLQDDLDRICEWSRKMEMRFNYAKCKVMHLGSRNPKHEYSMNDPSGGTVSPRKH